MDQITIKDLEVYANHGLYKEEKALGQKFLVSAILSLDTKLAGVSDQMDYSVDYGKVCHRITSSAKLRIFARSSSCADVV